MINKDEMQSILIIKPGLYFNWGVDIWNTLDAGHKYVYIFILIKDAVCEIFKQWSISKVLSRLKRNN